MRELLVLRHAKSSWKVAELDDHERPLNERGRRDAPRMGRLVGDRRLVPDRIVSSTAVRARATAEAVAEACGFRGEIVLTRQLYLADPEDCLALVAAVPAADHRVLLVGHNPCLEDLVEIVTGRPERMSTAALAWIALPVEEWAETTAGVRGELLALWRPKEV